jgi:hypothetical protein
MPPRSIAAIGHGSWPSHRFIQPNHSTCIGLILTAIRLSKSQFGEGWLGDSHDDSV